MMTAYGERDTAFGQTMLTLRTRMGLTQAELAEHLHVSRRAVGEWEAGSSYPKTEHLKHFIELAVQQQTFYAGREAEEIRTLWKMAHQKTLIDEQWLSALLDQQGTPLPFVQAAQDTSTQPQSGAGPRVDWGDALAIPTFYGREQEITTLTHWILRDRCRVISLLGMGGMGKSALAVHVMYQLAEQFEIVIFRSLRDAPSCEELLNDCLNVLALQPLQTMPATLERRISLLLEYLRASRTLVVLDNLETLLEEKDTQGRLQPGFEGYERLLRQIAETAHQSCLLLTSREKPAALRPLEGKRSLVRSLRLSGLDITACEHLFTEKDLLGTPQDQIRLAEVYVGNPLALKIVAETIVDLFGGAIDQFLAEGAVIFGNIANLLHEHLARLSPLEQTMLYWLAIVREPITFNELLAVLVSPLPPAQVLEALNGLRRRSLIEQGQRQGSFTLQSVVLEYVTTVLVTEATNELQQGKLDLLIQLGLEQAHTREYIRQTQERLLVAPILMHLQYAMQGPASVEEQLLFLLDQIREWTDHAQGYGPANLIALLRSQHRHLRWLDLSNLFIRGAYLQGIDMQDTSLAGATLRDTVFTEVLNAPWSVAISSSGAYWAAGSMQGEIHIWRNGIQILYRAWLAHTDTTIALSFSPDELTLASASWDGSLKLWDLKSGVLLWTGWHTKSVNSVAFSPNGRLLASGGNDLVTRIWDPQSGRNLYTLPHSHEVYAVAWSPDGHLLATGDFHGNIRLWQMQQTPPTICAEILSAHSNWVPGLTFSPDGSILASASWDHTVKLWEVPGGRLLQTCSTYTGRVNRVAWSPDGHWLASAGADTMIWLWDVERSHYQPALHGHSDNIYGLTFTPDSSHLLSGSEDGSLRVWDVVGGQCTHSLQGYAVSFYDIDWSPDSALLVSGGTDELVTIWDVNRGSPLNVLHGHDMLVFGVGWSPDGRFIASSSWDKTIRLWNSASGDCVQVIRDPDDPDTVTFAGMMWSPNKPLLVSGTNEHGLQVWDVVAHKCRWIAGGQMLTDDVAWSPDGTQIASSSDHGTVYLWNAEDGTLRQQLSGHHGRVIGVAWNPESTRLVSCGGREGKGELFVWNVQSGELLQALNMQSEIVSAVVWNPSTDWLVSGGSDGKLRWWNQNGQCLQVQSAHRGTVQSLKISPDGRKLASCSDDGAIMIWDLHSCEHLYTLRYDRPYERLNITGIRGLTREQKNALQALGAIEKL